MLELPQRGQARRANGERTNFIKVSLWGWGNSLARKWTGVMGRREWRVTRLRSLGGEAEMPAEATLQEAEQRAGHGAEIPFLHIAVLDVIGNAIRKDVVNPNVGDAEAVTLEKLPPFAARVGVGHGAAGLRFGVFGD